MGTWSLEGPNCKTKKLRVYFKTFEANRVNLKLLTERKEKEAPIEKMSPFLIKIICVKFCPNCILADKEGIVFK